MVEQQVIAAQEVLDSIGGLIKIGVDIKHVNDMLLKLYTIIPRKMDNVKYHLMSEIKDDNTLEQAQRLLNNEQSALDTMGGQVQLIKQQREAAKQTAEETSKGKKSKSLTILEQMGLAIEVENDKD
jgi:poly [ADP-ribose] polymerase